MLDGFPLYSHCKGLRSCYKLKQYPGQFLDEDMTGEMDEDAIDEDVNPS